MQDYYAYSDEELFQSIKRNDLAAFDELYSRYATNLIAYIHTKLGDVEESKDLVQEIFVTIWVDRKNILDLNSVSSYLYKIALNKSLNIFKRKKIKDLYIDSLSDYLANSVQQSDELTIEKDREEALVGAINELPDKMRSVFELRYFEGLSNIQVAERLGISQHTVATQMKRALKTIRKSIGLMTFIGLLTNL